MRIRILIGVVLSTILGTSAFFAATASQAQYVLGPVITVSVSQNTALPGEDVIITAQFLDEDGQPVANATLTFAIVSGPESASIGSRVTTKVADAQGVASATLNVGNEPNTTIVVSITSPDGVESTTIITVLGAPDDDDKDKAPITPPATGDAGIAGQSGTATGLAAAVVLISAIGLAAWRRFTASSQS